MRPPIQPDLIIPICFHNSTTATTITKQHTPSDVALLFTMDLEERYRLQLDEWCNVHNMYLQWSLVRPDIQNRTEYELSMENVAWASNIITMNGMEKKGNSIPQPLRLGFLTKLESNEMKI